ncbi:MAG: GNAT family N-acetyltransferase [Pseudomonadota bacterium]
MTVDIRGLEQGDRGQWEELFRGYIAFYEAEIPEAQYDRTFDALLSETAGTHEGLVAVDRADGRLVGIAHILFHRSTWSPSGYVYLEDLFVDPAHRGSGAGHKLIDAVYARADALGATRTYWATQNFNERARRLYDDVATLSPFVQYRR